MISKLLVAVIEVPSHMSYETSAIRSEEAAVYFQFL
jgi:hypothetical protein